MTRTYQEIKAYGELIDGLTHRYDEGILDEMIKDYVFSNYEESDIGQKDDLELIRSKFNKYIKEYETKVQRVS